MSVCCHLPPVDSAFVDTRRCWWKRLRYSRTSAGAARVQSAAIVKAQGSYTRARKHTQYGSIYYY